MSLKDHVYEYISKGIQKGTLKSNDKLNEQEISRELNISRTPVREALIQLAAEGLLISEPRKGFRVKPLTLKEAKDLYQIVGHLEAMAAVLALDQISPEDISRMERLKGDMDEAINAHVFDKYYKLQVEFHNIYLSKCGNDELINILKLLKKRFIRQGYSGRDPEGLSEIFKETNRQHGEMIELFKKKDSAQLEKYIKEVHWDIKYAALDVV